MRKPITPPVYLLIIFLYTTITISAQKTHKKVQDDLLNIEEKLYFYPAQGEDLLVGLKYRFNKKELANYQESIHFLHGLLAYKKAQPDSAIHHLEKALIASTKKKNKLYQAKSQLIIGWLSERTGYWEQAKLNYLKVIQVAQQKHTYERGMAYLGIARCKMFLRESPDDELEKGRALIKSLNSLQNNLYADYLACNINHSNPDKLKQLQHIANSYMDLGLNKKAAGVYKSISSYYRQKRVLDSALYYLDKAIPLSISDYPETSMTPSLHQHKGYVLLLKKEYKKARFHFNKSIELCDKYKQQTTKQYAYDCLYRLDTIQGDFKQAFYHLSEARKNEKILLNRTKRQLSKIMEVSANVKVLKEEAALLKNQEKNTILISIIIILTLLVVWITSMNRNKQKILREKEARLELQKLISGLGEVKLLQKNYTLSDQEKRETHLLPDQFEASYAEHIKRIRHQFKTLTDDDVRYVVMFAADISDDVIAQIRNINRPSILKTKRRIRTKLGLKKGHDLKAYFLPYLNNNSTKK
ncbi:tetratricopeptide repeat protein [Labilibacter marinus]|uniref:hypothetical protein n=1 Tax=Labilibacter marinus TaxID=1477105 RepID=UPI00094FE23C|nr:hypothetical protein [Labilibacter marinus]